MTSFLGMDYIRPFDPPIGVRERVIQPGLNIHRTSYKYSGHRWEFSVRLKDDSASKRAALRAHQAEYDVDKNFSVSTPQTVGVSGRMSSTVYPATFTVSVNALATAKSTTIRTRRTSLVNGVIYPGRFISFNGHDKVYMVLGNTVKLP